MSIRFLIITLAIIALVLPAVSATENFTKIIPSTDKVIVNQTFTRSDNPATPLVIFLLMAITGVILLVASFVLKPEHCNDIIGYIAPVPILFATIMAFGLDIRTSAGVASTVIDNQTKMMLIENHTIYTHPLVIIVLVILFIISILNIIRIYRQQKEMKFEGGVEE